MVTLKISENQNTKLFRLMYLFKDGLKFLFTTVSQVSDIILRPLVMSILQNLRCKTLLLAFRLKIRQYYTVVISFTVL